MKRLLLFLTIIFGQFVEAQIPKVSSGEIRHFEKFSSKYVAARNVDIWLPKNYTPTKKYSVLYMHDGQMLFDSSITWNKQEWQVDEKLGSLISNDLINPIIVVGIWNTGETRTNDYFPEKVLNYLPDSIKQVLLNKDFNNKPAQADNYLKFIVEELKPFVDSSFSTFKDKSHTYIAGSSKGGLISFYAFCEYNKVFGGAACLSTHWIGSTLFSDNTIPIAFKQYALEKLPKAGNGKLYFDFGTKTLDSLYLPYQNMMNNVLKKKRYTSKNWITKMFAGENHSEKAWAVRLQIPILFLFKK